MDSNTMLTTNLLPAILLQSAGGFSDLTWGLVLLGLGVILYIIEVINPGFYLAVPGTVLLVCGLLMVVDPSLFAQPWSWLAIIAISAASAWATIEVYKRLAPPEKSNTTFGVQNIVGQTGKADTNVTATSGTVLIQGEPWRAITAGAEIPKGARVNVVGLEGSFTVIVQQAE